MDLGNLYGEMKDMASHGVRSYWWEILAYGCGGVDWVRDA